MKKTFKDCAKCEYVSYCDAHISDGTHKHKEGNEPCQVTDESRKKKLSKPKKRVIKKHKSR